jgi:hypothetical protein
MRVFLEAVGILAVIQGVGGAVSDSGWFVINRLPFLEDYTVFAGIILAVLGVALWLAAASQKKGER